MDSTRRAIVTAGVAAAAAAAVPRLVAALRARQVPAVRPEPSPQECQRYLQQLATRPGTLAFGEAMLLAARFILGASLYRTESRLSHFREDHDARDDDNWLVWVDVADGGNGPSFSKTPVPTPYCSVTLPRRKPARLVARQQSVGGV